MSSTLYIYQCSAIHQNIIPHVVTLAQCSAVQHVPTVEYMSPWPSLHVQTWRYGCPRARLRWPVAGVGAEQVVTTALGLVLPR